MLADAQAATSFPTPLSAYPAADTLFGTLAARVSVDPFNGIATAIFLFAILHTFAAARFVALAQRVQLAADARARADGRQPTPSVRAEVLHFFGEVEVVFGLWAAVLMVAISAYHGLDTAKTYLNDTVDYTEALFVVVIMALASTGPIVLFAENALRRVAALGGATPAAWWLAILTIGPLLGSLITEPAAMTICALLLARQFFDLQPSPALKYATLGLLFVNVSIGGTLTHFAAPPVLMVSRVWQWDSLFMLDHFGWRAVLSVMVANAIYFLAFRRELKGLAQRVPAPEVDQPDEAAPAGQQAPLPVPPWLTAAHVAFMVWTVVNAHYPALFVGGFFFFLGFAKATAAYQTRIDLRAPLLVGFFLAGLVIHGGLQGWWIAPVLASVGRLALFGAAVALTAFNDNALITYLATLVPDLDLPMRIAVVSGAVVGGGLTVIANAPNPAGQALLSRFFDGSVMPGRLFLGALIPTLIAAAAFLIG